MTVTETDILRLAQLVRIGLEPVEARRLTAEMDVILEHVNRLQLVDTSGVGDSADHASNLMRDDTITPSLTVGEVLANAPEKHEMFFVVPAVLGEEPSGR